MDEALKKAIQAADGVGDLGERATGSGTAEHPVCGDVVAIDVEVRDGRIVDLAFRAQGCPATLAVAASARQALRGVAPADSAASLETFVAARGGLAPHERHALRIVQRAVAEAAVG